MKSSAKKSKTPLESFNGSSCRLGKMKSLLEYVGKNIDEKDFVVVLGSDANEIGESQLTVLRCFYRLSRESMKTNHLAKVFMYFLMRYDGCFTVEEASRTESSSGIRVRFEDRQEFEAW